METRFGTDFGSVRVHTNSLAAASAAAIGARAYTLGSEVVFGAGQYAPDTTAGLHTLAHELTHVVQQRSGGHDDRGPPADGSVVRRTCDQVESFYRSSPRYCRDDSFSPSTHSGKTCYRELLSSSFGCEARDHCCFDSNGTVEDSRDASGMANEKKANGACGWRLLCIPVHTLTDYVPAKIGEALAPLTQPLTCMDRCRNVPMAPLCMSQCMIQTREQ
jgi:hypothetical protein